MKAHIAYQNGRWYAIYDLYIGFGSSPARAFMDMCRKRRARQIERISLAIYHPCDDDVRKPSMWQQLIARFKK